MPRALPATSVSPFPQHTAHLKCPRRTEASIGTHPVPILVTPLTRTGPRWGRWRGATEGKSRREVVGRKLMMERIAPATACLILLLLQLLPDVYARIDSLNYLRTLRCIYTDYSRMEAETRAAMKFHVSRRDAAIRKIPNKNKTNRPTGRNNSKILQPCVRVCTYAVALSPGGSPPTVHMCVYAHSDTQTCFQKPVAWQPRDSIVPRITLDK